MSMNISISVIPRKTTQMKINRTTVHVY